MPQPRPNPGLAPPRRRWRSIAVVALGVAGAAGCDDGSTARIDALEARIAELERRTTDTAKAMEPLATLPNTVEQQQQSAKSIRDEQATLVARLARAEESVAALSAQVATLADAGGKPTTPPSTPPATPPATTPETGGTEALPKSLEVGVPECDEYLRKYLACIDTMPEAARASMHEAVVTMAEAWRDAASGPARTALGEACKSATEATAKAFASMGCAW